MAWTKDPQARKSYTFDWGDLTGRPPTDAITSATFSATPTGLNVEAPTVAITGAGRFVSVMVSGGALGVKYAVLCHVETASGQIDEQTEDLIVLNE